MMERMRGDYSDDTSADRFGEGASTEAMQYEVPLSVDLSHNMSGAPQYPSQNLFVPNGGPNGRIKTETGSERGVSPHASDPSSRYSSQTPQNSIAYQQIANQLSNGMRYPSPSQMGQQNNMSLMQHSYHPNAPQDQTYPQPQMGAVQPMQQQDGTPDTTGRSSSGLPKAFSCSTCQKGFARRSDLARHERIHSGVRPHVCDHPGCGKQFIQRSALTVHSRVHTGEKPHMCERCSKPFSDSSSLARHRRIHSGKRPYKCPYADCQKTFTRRTTLTRHQNHHTGTIEESEAATAAVLASRVSMQRQRSGGSDDENDFSEDGKTSMGQPDRTGSPAVGMNGVPNIQRQASEYYNMNGLSNNMTVVPPHLRGAMQPSRSSSPSQYNMQVNGQGSSRPGLTSNPSSGYNPPPQILEPPTNGQQPSSGHNSPHLGNTMGWQSPHNNLTGQVPHGNYSYPDPNQQYPVDTTTGQMYYASSSLGGRPHSTGPMDYQNQLNGREMWAQHQQ